jgi:hypothetical protein
MLTATYMRRPYIYTNYNVSCIDEEQKEQLQKM